MDLLIYGIPIINIAILIWIAMLISKRMDSHLSNKQKIDKEVKEKVITRDKKSLLSILEYIFIFALILIILSPVTSIYDLIIHVIFPFPLKYTVVKLILLVITFNIFILIYILSFIYVFKWLKKNLHPIVCEWERERKNRQEKKVRN
jgi:uncharacterized BrkB/YihY/UPF0761 family membrane protein